MFRRSGAGSIRAAGKKNTSADTEVLGRNQYSSGKKMQVDERSASVMTQNLGLGVEPVARQDSPARAEAPSLATVVATKEFDARYCGTLWDIARRDGRGRLMVANPDRHDCQRLWGDPERGGGGRPTRAPPRTTAEGCDRRCGRSKVLKPGTSGDADSRGVNDVRGSVQDV